MSLIVTTKRNITSNNIKEVFKNEEGAIDLASIMVGIVVIGLIGGVIAATVFSVIPWAQDNAAKQQLDTVAAAQTAFMGATTNTRGARFADGSAVPGVGLADPSLKLFDATAAKIAITANGAGANAHYGAAIQSASGKFFYIGDRKTQPTEAKIFTPGAPDDAYRLVQASTAGSIGDFDGNLA